MLDGINLNNVPEGIKDDNKTHTCNVTRSRTRAMSPFARRDQIKRENKLMANALKNVSSRVTSPPSRETDHYEKV